MRRRAALWFWQCEPSLRQLVEAGMVRAVVDASLFVLHIQ